MRVFCSNILHQSRARFRQCLQWICYDDLVGYRSLALFCVV
jgi:hypothetical protein